MVQIILYQPEIPDNTGNIIRTCSLTKTELALVPPLGFSMQAKRLKRAGLDYHDTACISYIEDIEGYLKTTSSPFYFFSSKAQTHYDTFPYTQNSILIFGNETKGLPSYFFDKWSNRFVIIPMAKGRCLNLATSVGIALYEVLRQTKFSFLSKRVKNSHKDQACQS